VRDVAVDQRGRILQEASIHMTLSPSARVDVGQQIIPLAYEGVTASGQIETIERTMFIAERTRGAGLGDIRDIGASMRGTLGGATLDYQLGLFNEMGESQNNTDQNDQKAAVGRIAFRVPQLPALQIGASGAFEGGPTPTQRRERAGAEVQLRTSHTTMRWEQMGARDGLVRRLGYYVLAAVRPTPDYELVARWDNWDPDLHHEGTAGDALERQVVLGANYYLDGSSSRLAANAIRSWFPTAPIRASNMLLLSFQVIW
jgi:hypothetical protein